MRREKGFTLLELMVVMAIIATLMTIALPRYFNSLEASRETTLRQSLSAMREALDHYYGDLSLIHISEPTRQEAISYAVFCL